VREVNGVAVVELLGRFETDHGIYELIELVETKLSEGFRLFLFNCAALRGVNSTCIGVLIACLKRVKDKGGRLLLCEVQPTSLPAIEGLMSQPFRRVYDSCERALVDLLKRG
jgi:anti-anti-sigma regulatory factor